MKTLLLALATSGVLAIFAFAWLLGGHTICAGYMAKYEPWSNTCHGGKLLQSTYTIGWSEHFHASVSEGMPWALLVAYLIALPLLGRLIRAKKQLGQSNR
jgi:hypothetical protein